MVANIGRDIPWKEYARIREQQRHLESLAPLVNIRRTIGSKFPIPGQFIFELIQNADDACATLILITLDGDNFQFEHNGSRVFKESDAIAISKIGFGGKENIEDSIGRFGLGFKALFEYTNQVEIHSGEFHFALEEYFYIKDNIPPIAGSAFGELGTVFKFTLDEKYCHVPLAKSVINDILFSIDHKTVLFLNNIRNIEVRIGAKNQIVKRFPDSHNVERISIISSTSTESTLWWRNINEISLTAFLGEPQTLKRGTMGFAIKIDMDEWKNMRILPKPVESGLVFSYFNLHEEKSDLSFFVHAPFFLEDNRLRFSVSPQAILENRSLLTQLGIMVGQTICTEARNGGNLNGLLSILPDKVDARSEFSHFTKALHAYLQGEQFINLSQDLWVLPKELVLLSPKLLSIFHKADLPIISRLIDELNGNTLRAAKDILVDFPPNDLSQHSLRVLAQSGMTRLDDGNIAGILEFFASAFHPRIPAPIPQRFIIGWIETRSVSQILSLWKLINEFFRDNEILKYFPIFPVSNAGQFKYRKADEIFLANDANHFDVDILDANFFNLESAQGDVEANEIGEVLRRFGITQKDKWEVLKRDYQFVSKREFDPEFEQKEFMRLLSFYQEDKSRLLNLIDQKYLLFSSLKNGTLELRKPIQTFMSNETNNNLLHHLRFSASNPDLFAPIWEGYETVAGGTQLLKALHVHFDLFTFKSGEIRSISYLNELLNEKNETALKELWNLVMSIDDSLFFTSVNTSRSSFFEETELCRKLKSEDWIPCSDGILRKPYDCTVELLHDDLEFGDSIALEKLDFAGAKRDAERFSEDRLKEVQKAGFGSVEEAEAYQKCREKFGAGFLNQILLEKEAEEARINVTKHGLESHNEVSEFGKSQNFGSNKSRDFDAVTSRPRYENDESAGERSPKTGNQEEIRHTSEIYVDSAVTIEGKEFQQRLLDIERRACDLVLEENKLLGRELTRMHQLNHGYDFECEVDGVKKFLEVKGTSQKWGVRGVSLSANELQTSYRHGPNYEVWVVEEVDSQNPKIWRIVDLPSQVGGYRLNDGWIPLSELVKHRDK